MKTKLCLGNGLGMGMGSGGGKAGFDPSKIAGLAAWFDASDLSTLTLDGTNVNGWTCKKTGKTLLPAAIDTTRPTYGLATKTVNFVATSQQRIGLATDFFTGEPFKSATKGLGQAWSLVLVANGLPNMKIGVNNAGVFNSTIRGGGSATLGGAMLLGFSTTIIVISKPAAINTLKVLDTVDDSSPFFYSDCSPIPTIYDGLTKQTEFIQGYNATSDGSPMTSGELYIGMYGSSSYWTGQVKEFILYDRDITEEELLRVITLLKRKWGI